MTYAQWLMSRLPRWREPGGRTPHGLEHLMDDPAGEIIAALNDSIDNCTRCKTCDTQDDVIRAAVASVLAAKDARIAELEARVDRFKKQRAGWSGISDLRAEANEYEATIARVKALHARVNTAYGKACDHCRGSDEEPIPWPCSTIAALAQPGDQEGTRP